MNISLIAAYDQDPHCLRPSPACLQSAVHVCWINLRVTASRWQMGASTNLQTPAEPLSQPHTNIWNDMELNNKLLQISQCSAAVRPGCRAGLSCCRLCSCTSSPRSAVVQWAAPARTTTPDTERGYLRNKEQLDILLERHESQIDIPLWFFILQEFRILIPVLSWIVVGQIQLSIHFLHRK